MGTRLFVIVLKVGLITAAINSCDKNGHRDIPHIGERFLNFRINENDIPYDDYRLQEGWYYAGPHAMTTTTPDDIFRCATKFPVWLNGNMLTDYVVTNETACQFSVIGECQTKLNIQILKCRGQGGESEDFFVYYLRPTESSNVGYCFGEGVPGTKPKHTFLKPTVVAKLATIPTPTQHRISTSTYFECDFVESKTEVLVYVVTWYVNNDKFHRTDYGTESEDDVLHLTEHVLHAKGFTLGSNVLTKELTFAANEKDTSARTIQVKPTVPIGCKGTNICRIGLIAYVPDAEYGTCIGLAFQESNCGVMLHSTNYSEITSITVTTNKNGQYVMPGVFNVYLKVQNTTENDIWPLYELPPIKVTITSPVGVESSFGSRCTSHNDPHLSKFDNMRFDNHQEGDYIFYRNTKYNTEVQTRYYTCGNTIKCNCGVAARAGRDVFEINVCDGRAFIGYRSCGSQALEVKQDSQRKYRIFFAYGTYVEVTAYSNYMSIEIIPSTEDERSTTGLCGILDGNCLNDFHYRNDTNGPPVSFGPSKFKQTNQPLQFIAEWIVQNDEENLFSSNFDLSKWTTWTTLMCVCENSTVFDPETQGAAQIVNSIPCNPNGVASCTLGRPIGTETCKVYSARKRRSLARDPVIPIVEIPESFSKLKRSKRSIVMTEPEAQQYCKGKIGSSVVFSLCSHVPSVDPSTSIDNCVVDILLTGTTNWTSSTNEAMQDACLSELRRNTTLKEATCVEPSIAEQIEIVACPGNCTENGNCDKGKCICDTGFDGSDCSIDLSRAPSLSGLLNNGLCDEADMPCDDAYIFGYIFTDSDKLTCRLEEFVITLRGERRPLETHHIKAQLETMIEAVCPLNQIRSRRSIPERSFVRGFTISVSNDGSNFEDGKDLFVFNSRCQEMRNDSNTLKFVLKVGFCYIDGMCVTDGATDTRDSCLVCDVNTNTLDWSTKRSYECADEVSTPDETSTQPLTTVGIEITSDETSTRPSITADIEITSYETSTQPLSTVGIEITSDERSTRPLKTSVIEITSEKASPRTSTTANKVLSSDVTSSGVPNNRLTSQKEEKDDPPHESYLWAIGVVVGVLICLIVGVVVVIRLTTKGARMKYQITRVFHKEAASTTLTVF